MNLRKTLMTSLLASTLSLSGGIALAQDATPDTSPQASPAAQMRSVTISTPDGDIAGTLDISEGDDGVTFTFESTVDSTLEPGMHGVHIHEVGSCDASGEKPYDSAGGHLNPERHTHGAPDDEGSHAGDLGNIEVADDGTYRYEVTTDKVTLDPSAENSLAGPSGSAVVIHAGEDDLKTDPAGDSGAREACGIIFQSSEPAPNATPPSSASPVATPEN
jgi:superoxide dismutase, Cu-Zn family